MLYNTSALLPPIITEIIFFTSSGKIGPSMVSPFMSKIDSRDLVLGALQTFVVSLETVLACQFPSPHVFCVFLHHTFTLQTCGV